MKIHWGVSTLLLLALNTPSQAKSYQYIEQTNLNDLSPKLRAQTHQKMTDLLLELSAHEKYPKYYPSHHSHIDWPNFLRNLTDSLIKKSYANGPSHCFFGGWPSLRNGSCSLPWSSASKNIASNMETAGYDHNFYCGSRNLFRCNPLIFGPGMAGANNGRKNNQAPYSAGICVEINGTYNGLSQKCQETSESLDRKRVAKGMKPWRESDFFDTEKAEDFKNIQGHIAQLCRENRVRLNKDNMCDSLEKSLLLTATAVEAQKMANISTAQLYPQCANIRPRAPLCNKDLDESYKPLSDALDTLRSQKGCTFKAVQAMKATMLNFLFENPQLQCHGKIAMAATREPLKKEDISVQLFGNDGEYIADLQAEITPDMGHDEIVKALTTGKNEKKYTSSCTQMICSKSKVENLAPLYAAIESLKNRDKCNFGSVNAVDFETGIHELYREKKCPSAIDGKIATEGLTKEKQKVSLIIRDKNSNYLTTVHADLSQEMNADAILQAFSSQYNHLDEACARANADVTVGPQTAAKELGIPDDQFIPSVWQENNLLSRIHNLESMKAAKASLDHEGNLILTGKDLERNIASLNQTLLTSAHISPSEVSIQLIEGGLKVTAPPHARVETFAHSSGVTLEDQEKELLVELDQASFAATKITRTKEAADGTQYLVLKGSFPQNKRDSFFSENEEILDGLVVDGLLMNCPEDKARPCAYLFTVKPSRTIASE